MPQDFEDLCNTLSMTEIVRLQNMLSTALVKRFEQKLALAFTDVVGSTPYFARFGNEAGRQMQQRHIDLVQMAIAEDKGRIVDTAGDGAFLCFPTVDNAASAMCKLLTGISLENVTRAREHQIAVRIGIHYGPVLTDGTLVTGDAVNFCARIAASSKPGEIRLTKLAFFALTDLQCRLKCRMLPHEVVKGIDLPVELLSLTWRAQTTAPTVVRLDTGEEFQLPDQDIITFGRLAEKDGFPANDIVLKCREETQTLQISRWHFELRRLPDGFVVRVVTGAPTALNGKALAKGDECHLSVGDTLQVGNVLSLAFQEPKAEANQIRQVETIIAPSS